MHHAKHRDHVVSILRRQAEDPAQRSVLEAVTAKTWKEADKGLATGPYWSVAAVDEVLGAGKWRCIHRIGVCQGVGELG